MWCGMTDFSGLLGDSQRGECHYLQMWEPFWNNCVDSHSEDLTGIAFGWEPSCLCKEAVCASGLWTWGGRPDRCSRVAPVGSWLKHWREWFPGPSMTKGIVCMCAFVKSLYLFRSVMLLSLLWDISRKVELSFLALNIHLVNGRSLSGPRFPEIEINIFHNSQPCFVEV